MSRSLVLGNGNMLLCFDKDAALRDLYFPYVGLENHIKKGYSNRVGVWVENKFSWLSKEDWQISVNFKSDTMASDIKAINGNLGVSLEINDVVYNEKNIFVRHLSVKNLSDRERRIKVFFNHQLKIADAEHADTAYYDPISDSIIHYEGRRIFLFGGRSVGKAFDEYSVGLLKIEGKDGTWKEAETGVLSKNAIEHGSVDSTIGFTADLSLFGSQDIFYWLIAGESFEEVKGFQKYVLDKKPEHLLKTTEDFWQAWTNKTNFTFQGLDKKVSDLFKKSLVIIRTHIDNRGGVLASGDSDKFQYGRDTYAYVWPRDGAFVAFGMLKAGYFDIAKRFFHFCNETITEEGYLLHKYQPDKSLGSSWHPWIKNGVKQLAIQEDETALPLYFLWEYYKETKDIEFIEEIYNSFIKKSADFLVSYRDKSTLLPHESYDLWEEKYGISTFTCSAVYGALIAAANFSEILGKTEEKRKYLKSAEEIKDGILEYLYNPENNYFYKLIKINNGNIEPDKTIDSSSFYGLFRFSVLLPNDPILTKAYEIMNKSISDIIPIGGLARYENDRYYKVSDKAPGNPWFIATLWKVQYEIAKASNAEELKKINEDLLWVVKFSLESGILSEQLNPVTGEHLSVSPLTWSHSEFVLTIIEYLEKLERLGIGNVSYPQSEY